jgi:hypothetical protein
MAYRSLVQTCMATSALVTLLAGGCYSKPDAGDLDTDGSNTESSTGGTETSITTEVTTDSNSASQSTTSPTTTPTGPSTTTSESDTDEPTTTSAGSTGAAAECGDGNADPGELCFDVMAEELSLGQSDPVDVGIGDIDTDGELDIVTLCRGASASGDETIVILEGDGLGGFGAPSTQATPNGPFRVQVLDGDGDGDDDIAVGASGGLQVWTNVDGAFLSSWSSNQGLSLSSLDVSEMLALPIDGTQGLDLLISEAYSQEFRAGSVVNQRWRLDGSPVTIPGSVEGASGLIAAKFGFDNNGDDDWDAVLLNQYETGASIVVGAGDGTFTDNNQDVSLCSFGSRYGDAGDFDGDDDVDLVAVCMGGDFVVALGNGDGTFADAQVSSLDGAWRPQLADLDADGNLDLLVSSSSLNRVVLYRGAGDGSFALSDVDFGVAGPVYGFAVVDLDDNGALDVVVPWDDGNGAFVSIFYADS